MMLWITVWYYLQICLNAVEMIGKKLGKCPPTFTSYEEIKDISLVWHYILQNKRRSVRDRENEWLSFLIFFQSVIYWWLNGSKLFTIICHGWHLMRKNKTFSFCFFLPSFFISISPPLPPSSLPPSLFISLSPPSL